MMDIKTLVSAMRHCVETCDCATCPVDIGHGQFCITRLFSAAADAIEELISKLNHADAQIQSLVEAAEERRWIPVTERLPKDNEAVNVTWINRDPASYYQHIKDKPFVATAVYYREQWYWWSSVVEDYLAEYGECDFEKIDEAIDITHWMPLPTPPEEETE